jgi:transmembrane sensor
MPKASVVFYMTQDNRIWVLMSRRLSDEATEAEAEELRSLLEQSPDEEYLFGVLHSYFTGTPSLIEDKTGEDAGVEERFRRIVDLPARDPYNENDKKDSVRRVRRRRSIGYAAAAAAILFLVVGARQLLSRRGAARAATHLARTEEVLARAGTRTTLVLPDGTRVWLNSNSKLRYDSGFNSSDREVVLEGEAFFDVIKNAAHPFIVHATSLDIEVLGTSFEVKSYPQDATVETTLFRGAIEVRRKGNPNTARVILKPNEKLVFSKVPLPQSDGYGQASGRREGDHPEATGIAVNYIQPNLPDSEKVETAWMYNRLVFDGDNFGELAEKMERWYDVRIVVRDTALNHYHFGGVFQNESIEEALKDLQMTATFTYTIDGKKIELYAKK